jgi:hypothetical protein
LAPRVLAHPGTRTTRRHLIAIEKSSAARAHRPTEDHDDTIGAHYSYLERLRPHACMEGVVYVGHMVVSDDGAEVEVVEAVPPLRG